MQGGQLVTLRAMIELGGHVLSINYFDYYIDESNYFLPFNETLEFIASGGDGNKIAGCSLRKFTLPVSESFELLHILNNLDISPSTIYPGYHSIISDLQNQIRWV